MEIRLKRKYTINKPTQDGYKPPAKSGNGTKKRPNKNKKKIKDVQHKVLWVKGLTNKGKIVCCPASEWDKHNAH